MGEYSPVELPAVPEELPPGWKVWRMSVSTRRIITTLPQKQAQTEACVWILGDMPAPSAMKARNLYWSNCPHFKPLLDRNGIPVGKSRMKIGEIMVREVESRNA